MNRRNFLKSLGAACATAVVAPVALLKKKRHPGLDKIPVEYIGRRVKLPWKHFYMDYNYSQIHKNRLYAQLCDELEKEFWNTEFKSPLIIGAHDETTKT